MSAAKMQARDFFELVKAIGESKSKQEEDRIIAEEVLFLKKAVPAPGTSKKKMKELVIRSLYVEMLGNDASFAYIKAVELCASTSIAQKRAGYLAAALCLSPEHEFRFMLVNMIQRDMKSNNQLEVCAALAAVNKIVTVDMIPAVIGDVLRLLKHEMELVRKKAVCALHRLYQMDSGCLVDHVPKVRGALCDRDPSVMGATLPLFADMAKDQPQQFKDLVPSFVSILKQLTDHRLPREYDYHRIPAPWIQMNLLRVLSILGRGDQQASEGMYEVLVDVMKRADTGINIGYAIVYEVVKTVTSIYPNTVLLDAAATSISRFIRSDSHNLKYIGIKGLASIVKDHPRYAADHQMAVIDCLEDPDETLKRKTLDLLFRMTNAVNVEFIVEKLLTFLAGAIDDHFRTALVGQITQCAERFAPSNAWYVQTVIRVFELAGEKVKPAVAHTLTQLIAEGSEVEEEEDDEGVSADDELRTEAVENFLDLIDKPKLPDVLAQAMAWVLGEYGYLSSSCSKEEIMGMLCALAEQTDDSATRSHVISAIIKLVAQNGSCPSRVMQLMERYSRSSALDVQQRCLEFRALLQRSEAMVEVLPVDASCEDIEVDRGLSFLNAFVQAALNTGAKPYCPPQDFVDEDEDANAGKPSLNITPYAKPSLPPTTSMATVGGMPSAGMSSSGGGPGGSGGHPTPLGPATVMQTPAAPTQGNQLLTARAGAQVWGKKPPVPPPAPTASAAAPNTAHLQTGPDAGDNGMGGMMAGMTISNAGAPTGVITPAAPAAEPTAPAGPRVLSEKERMAAALFGGVPGGRAPAPTTGRDSAARARRRSQQTGAQPAPTTGGAGAVTPEQAQTTTTATTSNAAAVAPSAGADMDLLGMDLLGSPAPAAPAPVAHSHQPIDMDILSSSSSSASPHPASPPAAPSIPSSCGGGGGGGSASISDAFADLDMGSVGGSLSPTGMGSAGGFYPGQQQQQQAPVAMSVQPLPINTAEFGRRWGSTPFDQKQSVACGGPTGPTSLEQLRQAMPGTYHHVESIPTTQEAIYAATVPSVGGVVLVHAKLNPARRSCDLVVKSSSREVAAQEAATLVAVLAAFRRS